MPAFHQRPLTWLFFIALACLNVVAQATGSLDDWYAALLSGQLFIAGGWLALGQAHRLTRAAVFMAVVLGTTAPYYFSGDSWALVLFHPGLATWQFVLGTVLFLAAVTAISCWCSLLIIRLAGRGERPSAASWQFPLAEVFGWMIIVAVGATTLPWAVFPYRNGIDSDWRIYAVEAAVAGLMMTLFLRPGCSSDLMKLGAVASTFVALTIAMRSNPAQYDVSIMLSYLAVGFWILVQRLDGRLATVRPEGSLCESPGAALDKLGDQLY